jgi:hypothetical protein
MYEGCVSCSESHFLPQRLRRSVNYDSSKRTNQDAEIRTRLSTFPILFSFDFLLQCCSSAIRRSRLFPGKGGKIEARGIINERRENYPVFISVFGASINAVFLGLCKPYCATAPSHCLILECNGECRTCVVSEVCASKSRLLLRI